MSNHCEQPETNMISYINYISIKKCKIPSKNICFKLSFGIICYVAIVTRKMPQFHPNPPPSAHSPQANTPGLREQIWGRGLHSPGSRLGPSGQRIPESWVSWSKSGISTHPFEPMDSLHYMGRGAAERGSEWGPLEGVVQDGGPPCLDLRGVLRFTIITITTHHYQHW